jgi:hypothetical protein
MKPAKYLWSVVAFSCLFLSLHTGASDHEKEQEIRSIYKNLIDA